MVKVDWDPIADFGGSSWVQSPDGDILCVYYTADENRYPGIACWPVSFIFRTRHHEPTAADRARERGRRVRPSCQTALQLPGSVKTQNPDPVTGAPPPLFHQHRSGFVDVVGKYRCGVENVSDRFRGVPSSVSVLFLSLAFPHQGVDLHCPVGSPCPMPPPCRSTATSTTLFSTRPPRALAP